VLDDRDGRSPPQSAEDGLLPPRWRARSEVPRAAADAGAGGFSCEEIARELKLSSAAVMTQLFPRARQAQAALGGEEEIGREWSKNCLEFPPTARDRANDAPADFPRAPRLLRFVRRRLPRAPPRSSPRSRARSRSRSRRLADQILLRQTTASRRDVLGGGARWMRFAAAVVLGLVATFGRVPLVERTRSARAPDRAHCRTSRTRWTAHAQVAPDKVRGRVRTATVLRLAFPIRPRSTTCKNCRLRRETTRPHGDAARRGPGHRDVFADRAERHAVRFERGGLMGRRRADRRRHARAARLARPGSFDSIEAAWRESLTGRSRPPGNLT
jgi:hypothetical protein